MFTPQQDKISALQPASKNNGYKSSGHYLKDNRLANKPAIQKKEKVALDSTIISENQAPVQMAKGGGFLSKIGSGLYSGASYLASATATGLSKGSDMVINTAKAHPLIGGSLALMTAYASPAIVGGIALATAAGAGIKAYSRYKHILKRKKAGEKGLEQLPKSEMWRMYINPKDHEKAINASKKDIRMRNKPGEYYRYYDENDEPKKDNEISTHFGNSMLDAIHSELFFKGDKLGPKVDYKEYTRLHDLVTGRFAKGGLNERGSINNMRKPSSNAEKTAFPMNDWNEDESKPADDLMHESINEIPMVHDWKDGENMIEKVNQKVTYHSQNGYLRVLYDENKGKEIAQQILDRYYKEINGVENREQKIKIIVKAIRALHVAHPFKDANGRLHIQLMLNKFLLEQGFSPTILGHRGLGIFGGAISIEEITKDVTEGMDRFKSLTK